MSRDDNVTLGVGFRKLMTGMHSVFSDFGKYLGDKEERERLRICVRTVICIIIIISFLQLSLNVSNDVQFTHTLY